MMLPFGWSVCLGLVAAWLTFHARRRLQRRRAAEDCVALELIADGSIRVLDRHGHAQAARMLPGSFVGRHLAWLRLETEQSGQIAEFLAKFAVETRDWHRLQLLWQLRAQYFGGFQGT